MSCCARERMSDLPRGVAPNSVPAARARRPSSPHRSRETQPTNKGLLMHTGEEHPPMRTPLYSYMNVHGITLAASTPHNLARARASQQRQQPRAPAVVPLLHHLLHLLDRFVPPTHLRRTASENQLSCPSPAPGQET